MKRRVLVFSVLVVSCALAQESRPVLRGVWGATAGTSGTFRGRWWAEIEASEAASGSWTLLDDSNRIVLEGTWSARRVNAPAKLTVPHWQGYLDGSRRCGTGTLRHVAGRSCRLQRKDIRGHAETDGGTAGFRFLAQRTRSGELAASRIKMVRTACLVSPSGIEVFFAPL